MKKIYIVILLLTFSNCIIISDHNSTNKSPNYTTERNIEHLNYFLNRWHIDVANYDFDAYFGKMSNNSIFIGTDASENWTIQQFKEFAKPHFDKKKTWDFMVLERNLYFNTKGDIAWFDELLDTWMGVCRGSGVLSKKNNNWKIEHYVLSIVIPNENVSKVVELKKEKDRLIIQSFKNKN
ncbi:MAG: nuclear transport factor 2 family protein [Bacteroidetes bacterium]|nr:nuclear transport factor 2 family protein [Bacteroidota bacterium]